MTKPRNHVDAGFSLIELVVAVALLGIVSATMFNFASNTMTATTRASRQVRSEQNVMLALRSISEDLRSGQNLTECAPGTLATCLTFDVPRSQGVGTTCPSRTVTYTLVGSTVQQTEQVYPAGCGAPTTKFSGRVILEKVDGSTSLFTYYDKTGAVITDPATIKDSAASVRVAVSVDYGVNGAPKLSLSSTAALRNER